jgi:hypothetical protein
MTECEDAIKPMLTPRMSQVQPETTTLTLARPFISTA